jgi:hypothetical protein
MVLWERCWYVYCRSQGRDDEQRPTTHDDGRIRQLALVTNYSHCLIRIRLSSGDIETAFNCRVIRPPYGLSTDRRS